MEPSADSGIDIELLTDFIAETLGEIDNLDEKFIQLEKSPADTTIIDSIFRPVHSIKGSSAFFNLNNIRIFAHRMESLLDDLRKGKMPVTQDVIDALLTGIDFLRAMFKRIDPKKLEDKPNSEEEEFLEGLGRFTVKKEEKPGEALQSYFIQLRKVQDRFMMKLAEEDKDKAVKDIFEIMDKLEEQLTTHGILKHIEAPKHLGEILVEKGKISTKDIEDALKQQKKVGTILVETGKITEKDIEEALQSQEKEKEKAKPPAIEKLSVRKYMRVEEDKVDTFLNYIGELIISSEVYRYLQKRLELAGTQGVLTREFKNANLSFLELSNSLQKSLMEIRRVSVKSIFQKIPRLVRDLSKNLGKEIELVLEGEDTSIDKSIVEGLENSVIHMVRNSVDHGVETIQEREKKGKSPSGKIEVSAYSDEEYFYLRIADDGKGMDPEIIRQKAIEKGLTTPEQAAALSKSDTLKFIFGAGFSTAKQVTDVSGRGVGMDVVMTEIKKFKGVVDMDSEVDKGSQFTLKFPLAVTLTIIDGLLVSVGKEKYVIPLNMIKESVCPRKEQVMRVKYKGEMVSIRETLYPIVRIHELFGVRDAVQNPWESVMVVVESDNKRCCLMVDSLLEKQQVVLKDIGRSFKHIETIAGGSILGDGKVGLVLNVDGIMNKSL
ncbi:MAG: chemotaxis protein CheA [Nitrospinae bacterium]|nr:chemotaxis protein CheA [Nitrospinota bacterium]